MCDAILYHSTSDTSIQTSCKWLFSLLVEATLEEARRGQFVIEQLKTMATSKSWLISRTFFQNVMSLYRDEPIRMGFYCLNGALHCDFESLVFRPVLSQRKVTFKATPKLKI